MAIGCMPTSEEAQARTSKAIAVVLLQLLLGVAMLVTLTSNPRSHGSYQQQLAGGMDAQRILGELEHIPASLDSNAHSRHQLMSKVSKLLGGSMRVSGNGQSDTSGSGQSDTSGNGQSDTSGSESSVTASATPSITPTRSDQAPASEQSDTISPSHSPTVPQTLVPAHAGWYRPVDRHSVDRGTTTTSSPSHIEYLRGDMHIAPNEHDTAVPSHIVDYRPLGEMHHRTTHTPTTFESAGVHPSTQMPSAAPLFDETLVPTPIGYLSQAPSANTAITTMPADFDYINGNGHEHSEPNDSNTPTPTHVSYLIPHDHYTYTTPSDAVAAAGKLEQLAPTRVDYLAPHRHQFGRTAKLTAVLPTDSFEQLLARRETLADSTAAVAKEAKMRWSRLFKLSSVSEKTYEDKLIRNLEQSTTVRAADTFEQLYARREALADSTAATAAEAKMRWSRLFKLSSVSEKTYEDKLISDLETDQ